MVHEAINDEIEEQREKINQAIDSIGMQQVSAEQLSDIKDMLEGETDLLDLIQSEILEDYLDMIKYQPKYEQLVLELGKSEFKIQELEKTIGESEHEEHKVDGEYMDFHEEIRNHPAP